MAVADTECGYEYIMDEELVTLCELLVSEFYLCHRFEFAH